jgi:hypothetical protein
MKKNRASDPAPSELDPVSEASVASAGLRAQVAKQQLRLAKDRLKRARKQVKDAKREARRLRKRAAAEQRAWKRALRKKNGHKKPGRKKRRKAVIASAAHLTRSKPARGRGARRSARRVMKRSRLTRARAGAR